MINVDEIAKWCDEAQTLATRTKENLEDLKSDRSALIGLDYSVSNALKNLQLYAAWQAEVRNITKEIRVSQKMLDAKSLALSELRDKLKLL